MILDQAFPGPWQSCGMAQGAATQPMSLLGFLAAKCWLPAAPPRDRGWGRGVAPSALWALPGSASPVPSWALCAPALAWVALVPYPVHPCGMSAPPHPKACSPPRLEEMQGRNRHVGSSWVLGALARGVPPRSSPAPRVLPGTAPRRQPLDGQKDAGKTLPALPDANCQSSHSSRQWGPANPFTMGLIANQTDFTLPVPLTMRLGGEGGEDAPREHPPTPHQGAGSSPGSRARGSAALGQPPASSPPGCTGLGAACSVWAAR